MLIIIMFNVQNSKCIFRRFEVEKNEDRLIFNGRVGEEEI